MAVQGAQGVDHAPEEGARILSRFLESPWGVLLIAQRSELLLVGVELGGIGSFPTTGLGLDSGSSRTINVRSLCTAIIARS